MDMAKHFISLTLQGEEREGGYTYFTSPELKGFRFLLGPDESLEDVMFPVLTEHLQAYLSAQPEKAAQVGKVEFAPRADQFKRHPKNGWSFKGFGSLPVVAALVA